MISNSDRLTRLVENHIEKALLAAAGLFTLWVAYGYACRGANRCQFEGRGLTASQLNPEILASARRLEAAVRTAAPGEVRREAFSQELRRRFAAGLFDAADAATPPLQPALPALADWGRPLEPVGASGDAQPARKLALVEPLPPGQPAVRTGRSMIRREGAAPVETAWVSVAAIYDVQRQRADLERAGYAAPRAAVHVADVELQRQELLPGGAWSAWTPVPVESSRRPPEPIFDAASGALLNRDSLDDALAALKGQQEALMQPAFPTVAVGDTWELPPLAGFSIESVADPGPDATTQRPPRPRPPPVKPHPPRPTGASPTSPPRGASADGHDDEAPPSGELPGLAAARQRAVADLRRAGEAIRQRDYVAARAALRRIVDSADAPETFKAQARRLLARVEREAAAAAAAQPVPWVCTPGGAPAVWRHDLGVEGGRTYRYRMRVWLWNSYVGRAAALTNPSEAHLTAVPGAWSQPSDPVTAAPRTCFFVTRPAANRPGAASVEVWRWLDGEWIRQRFEVAAGDEIGGVRKVPRYREGGGGVFASVDFSTGAVVTDIRSEPLRIRVPARGGGFTQRAVESLVLTYVDPGDGQIKERAAELDRSDPIRNRLKEDELP